jgi:hypothetical protein
MGDAKSRDLNAYVLSVNPNDGMKHTVEMLRPGGNRRVSEIATKDEVR